MDMTTPTPSTIDFWRFTVPGYLGGITAIIGIGTLVVTYRQLEIAEAELRIAQHQLVIARLEWRLKLEERQSDRRTKSNTPLKIIGTIADGDYHCWASITTARKEHEFVHCEVSYYQGEIVNGRTTSEGVFTTEIITPGKVTDLTPLRESIEDYLTLMLRDSQKSPSSIRGGYPILVKTTYVEDGLEYVFTYLATLDYLSASNSRSNDIQLKINAISVNDRTGETYIPQDALKASWEKWAKGLLELNRPISHRKPKASDSLIPEKFKYLYSELD